MYFVAGVDVVRQRRAHPDRRDPAVAEHDVQRVLLHCPGWTGLPEVLDIVRQCKPSTR